MLEPAPKLSRHGEDSLAVMAIVAAIALADGWDSLDECLAENTGIIDTYMRFADAALRAIRRLHRTETAH